MRPVGVANPAGTPSSPVAAYFRWRVVSGRRTPAGSARSCSSVTPLGARRCSKPASMSPPKKCSLEAEPGGELEDDLDVRTGFADRRDQRRAQLHERLGVLGDLEADLQPLGFEGTRHR